MKTPVRLLSVIFLSACLFTSFAHATPNDADQVREAVAGFSQAWNHHDMVAFGRIFAPDADFVNVGGVRMKGRQDIQMHHAYSHGAIPADANVPGASRAHYGIFKSSVMRFARIDVRFLRSDVAVAHVNWELSGDSRTPNPRRGVLTFVLTRQNGHWLIAAAQNTEIARTVK